MGNQPLVSLLPVRVSARERQLIDAAAAADGVPVSVFCRRLLLPAVSRRITEQIAAQQREEADLQQAERLVI